MTFVLRMAVRETRASWKRLLFFFVCIAIGVAAIVTLGSIEVALTAVAGVDLYRRPRRGIRVPRRCGGRSSFSNRSGRSHAETP